MVLNIVCHSEMLDFTTLLMKMMLSSLIVWSLSWCFAFCVTCLPVHFFEYFCFIVLQVAICLHELETKQQTLKMMMMLVQYVI